MEWSDQEDKQLVITDGEAVLSKPLLSDLTSLAPCIHEEADSRMSLHASHAAQHGHHAILIRTVDTDVVVLAVFLAQELQPEDKLWLAFGTGQSFRYLAAHEIAAGLGQEKPRAQPLFHALTGCDTVVLLHVARRLRGQSGRYCQNSLRRCCCSICCCPLHRVI